MNLPQISTFAKDVDTAFFFIVGWGIFLLVGVTVAMIYLVIRYHRRFNTKVENISHNLTLELLWTILPTILVLAMFWYGFVGYNKIVAIPDNAIKVIVHGWKWAWMFEYETGKESNILVLPVNRPVRFVLRSRDVLHSFYIPAFRLKKDVLPVSDRRKPNEAWVEATAIGEYTIFCAEYCGEQHSKMGAIAKVVTGDEFDRWVKEGAGEILAGSELLKVKGCIACHSSDGSALVGPTFKGLYQKEHTVVVEGKEVLVVADENYLRESIKYPNKHLVKGYQALMPELPIKDKELDRIVEHIKGLK